MNHRIYFHLFKDDNSSIYIQVNLSIYYKAG